MNQNTLTVAEAAARLGCSAPTLRRSIKRQDAQNKPDSLRFCPGGRVESTKYYVIRAIFETVMQGRAIDAHLRAPISITDVASERAA